MPTSRSVSFDADPLCEEYDVLQRKYGIDVAPYPYSVTGRGGQQIQVRQQDGRWSEVIYIDMPGRHAHRFTWTQRCHPNPLIEWAARTFAIDRIQSHINQITSRAILNSLQKLSLPKTLNEAKYVASIGKWAKSQLEEATERRDPNLYAGIREFYSYSLDEGTYGFDEATWIELSDIIKGDDAATKLAVSMLSAEDGPYSIKELQDIDLALASNSAVSNRTRALVALCRDWGLRPIQLSLLRVTDFGTDESGPFIYVPSVKGRVRSYLRRHPSNLKKRLLTDGCADLISTHIESNNSLIDDLIAQLVQDGFSDAPSLPRPLFPIRQFYLPRIERFSNSPELWPFALHQPSSSAMDEIRGLTTTLAIPNMRTSFSDHDPTDPGSLLEISATRFRRTRGTSMVLNGSTPEEVAEALDHKDVTSVHHYFMFTPDLISMVNTAFSRSSKLSGAVDYWTGRFSTKEDEQQEHQVIRLNQLTSLGLCKMKGLCPFHPTVSCYACHHFRPSRDGAHSEALVQIESLQQMYDSTSTGSTRSQLDEAHLGARAIVAATRSGVRP